jgi:CBS domain-containing protein
MATVKELLVIKGQGENLSVSGSDMVLKALEVMAEANIGAVMVIEEERVVGIFTERDYTRKCELKGVCAKETPVQDVMTTQMLTVNPNTSMDQCMALMNQYHIRHLPVIDKDAMVGMVSIRDVVDMLLSDRESTIIGLENYILGSDFAT